MGKIILICLIFLMGCPDSKNRNPMEPEINESTTGGKVVSPEGDPDNEVEDTDTAETDYDSVLEKCEGFANSRRGRDNIKAYLRGLGELHWEGIIAPLPVYNTDGGGVAQSFIVYFQVGGSRGKTLELYSRGIPGEDFEDLFGVSITPTFTLDRGPCYDIRGDFISIN